MTNLRIENHKQDGAALIITLIVLLVLTIVAIASTNSNQTQAIMARNSQFRLEVFNTSYAEIDSQIDFINNRSLAEGAPDYLNVLIDGNVGDSVSDQESPGSGREIDLLSAPNNEYIEAHVKQTFKGHCLVFGQEIGVGKSLIKCNEIDLETNSDLKDTSVSSLQHQIFEYKTL